MTLRGYPNLETDISDLSAKQSQVFQTAVYVGFSRDEGSKYDARDLISRKVIVPFFRINEIGCGASRATAGRAHGTNPPPRGGYLSKLSPRRSAPKIACDGCCLSHCSAFMAVACREGNLRVDPANDPTAGISGTGQRNLWDRIWTRPLCGSFQDLWSLRFWLPGTCSSRGRAHVLTDGSDFSAA